MKHVIDCYENYKEEARLTTNNARRIEYLTTIRALEGLLPKSGKILDCAAGTGIYAFYYAEKGYEVTATDITPRHIEYMNKALVGKDYSIQTAVMDATDLKEFKDDTFDVVLCMGPFYHLLHEEMRNQCLSEALRVLKPGGIMVTAYIPRFFVFPYVALSDHKYLNNDLAKQLIETGTIRHDDPLCFWTDTYYATPIEMENIYKHFNIELLDHLATDGLSPILKDKIDPLNETEFEIWCDYHYSICREQSLLGASNHNIIVGRKV